MKSNDINILDDGWMEVPFSYMAEHISKRVDPKDTDLDVYIGLEHIDPGSLKIKRHGKPEDVKGTKLIAKPGDIIFGKRRAYQGKVGVCEWDAIVSAHSMVLRPKEENIERDFLKFFMQSEEFYNRSIQISEGSLSPTIKWKVLEGQKFIIPNRNEQKKIVNKISSINNTIEKYENLLVKAELYYKKIINNIFEYGLYKEECKKSTIGNIPKSWKLKKLDECISIQTGISYKSSDYGDEENGLKLLNLKCVFKNGGFKEEGIKYFKNIYDSKYLISEKDIIIANTDLTRNGDVIGCPVVIPEEIIKNKILFTMDLSALRVKSKELNIKFIYYYLKTDYSRRYMRANASGSTVLHLNLQGVSRMNIPIPTLNEQLNIVKVCDNIDVIIKNIESNIEKNNELKKYILKKLLTYI